MVNFSTFARRAAQVGSGLAAGAQERSQRLRSEQLDLLTRGMELGAQGVDITPFIGEDMVSRGNRDFLRDFGQMGRQFTQPYYDRMAAETAAAEQEHARALELKAFEQDQRIRLEAQRREWGHSSYRPGGRGGSGGRAYDLDDQHRYDEQIRETLRSRIVANMGINSGQAEALASSGQLEQLVDAALAEANYDPAGRDQSLSTIYSAADDVAGRAQFEDGWFSDPTVTNLDSFSSSGNDIIGNLDQTNEVTGDADMAAFEAQIYEIEELVDTGQMPAEQAARRLQEFYGDAFTFDQYLYMVENGIPR